MSKVKLGDVAIESREVYKGDKAGMPIVGLEHLTPEDVILSNWDHNTENTFTKMFRKGDMLFGRRRAYLKKAAQAPFDGICSGDITVIRAKSDKLLPELLPFIIQNENLFDFAVGKSAGSLSPRVKWENLQNFTFELPRLDEQKKLATVLWSINDTLQAYQNLLNQTDELVKSQFIEMVEENNMIPKVELGNLFDISSGGTPSRSKTEYWENGDIPWVKISDMKSMYPTETEESITKLGLEKSSAKLFSKGTFLISIFATLGEVSILDIDATTNQAIAGMTPKEDIDIEYTYIALSMLKDKIIEIGRGAAQNNINLSILKKLTIPMPDAIIRRQFSTFVRQSDMSKVALQNAITAAQETKRSIISDALGIMGKE